MKSLVMSKQTNKKEDEGQITQFLLWISSADMHKWSSHPNLSCNKNPLQNKLKFKH